MQLGSAPHLEEWLYSYSYGELEHAPAATLAVAKVQTLLPFHSRMSYLRAAAD
jgi:ABC-type uncharacterized transport system involved in gliding motility auxiliary subunit